MISDLRGTPWDFQGGQPAPTVEPRSRPTDDSSWGWAVTIGRPWYLTSGVPLRIFRGVSRHLRLNLDPGLLMAVRGGEPWPSIDHDIWSQGYPLGFSGRSAGTYGRTSIQAYWWQFVGVSRDHRSTMISDLRGTPWDFQGGQPAPTVEPRSRPTDDSSWGSAGTCGRRSYLISGVLLGIFMWTSTTLAKSRVTYLAWWFTGVSRNHRSPHSSKSTM